MTSLTDYILINHHLMTVREMAEETGEKEYTIRNACKKLGVEPISNSDRIREYIKAHPKESVEMIAARFDVTPESIYAHARTVGVKLGTWEPKDDPEPIVKLTPVKMHSAVYEYMKERGLLNKGVKRVSEAYSQSGSPYGLADQIRKIKTK